VLGKLIQHAKVGYCSGTAPTPEEVSWISLRVKEKDSKVTPDSLLSKEDFEAIVKAAENPRDKALVYVLFEDALRPGELLAMTVGSVEFKDKYCLIAVNGKTGIKRIPPVYFLQASFNMAEGNSEKLAENSRRMKQILQARMLKVDRPPFM